MSSWARVGVKCVCVDATNSPGCSWKGDEKLSVGDTLTVASVWMCPVSHRLVCDFVEKKRSRAAAIQFNVPKMGYWVNRFRPLVSQEQDVALFKSLLTPAPELVE